MASLFSIKIDNLRKRSRVLLTCLEENAKFVRKEVKKLRLQDSSSYASLKRPDFICARNSDIWKLRNDSSGVGAALCPDYFRFSPKYESLSAPEMSGPRRLLIKTEKKKPKPSPPRRGIKECYCYTSLPDTRNINQRSTRTKLKFNPVNSRDYQLSRYSNCGDGATTSAPGSARIDNTDLRKARENEGRVYSPPLSTATLRRAQKIDYTPRSKFLRKVQSKINTLRTSSAESLVEETPRSPSPSPPRFTTNNDGSKNRESEIARSVKSSKHVNERAVNSRNEYPRKHNCLRSLDNEFLDNGGDKIPKKTLPPKKTIVSKKPATDHQHRNSESKSNRLFDSKNHACRRTVLRSPPPSKGRVRKVSRDYSPRENMEDRNMRQSLPRDYQRSCPCSEIFDDEPLRDFEINNVRKFREKNYFDTHASDPSLLGSRSSGSLQQFRLNERLFPEPIGKIHRDNLVVSIPPCATRQKRTIHYFPRSVVRQEKNVSSNNDLSKKRRCPSCPLIGHAVDLGALKVSHPTNSLALRYQKGIP